MVAGACDRNRHDLGEPAASAAGSAINKSWAEEVRLGVILRGIGHARDRRERERAGIEDLSTQLETLFDLVWRQERTWSLEDRIDRLIKYEGRQQR